MINYTADKNDENTQYCTSVHTSVYLSLKSTYTWQVKCTQNLADSFTEI